MIYIIKGNLLNSKADALINAVNTQGIMGKGIALQFKKKYPDMYKIYLESCRCKDLKIGKMQVIPLNGLEPPFYIINFPTKEEWKNPSKMEYIENGLIDLIDVVISLNIRSMAIPALGCGNGGLEWSEVKIRIDKAFSLLPNVQFLLYEPISY